VYEGYCNIWPALVLAMLAYLCRSLASAGRSHFNLTSAYPYMTHGSTLPGFVQLGDNMYTGFRQDGFGMLKQGDASFAPYFQGKRTRYFVDSADGISGATVQEGARVLHASQWSASFG
jgi:hypothetical protein